jgi:hypothetical protein
LFCGTRRGLADRVQRGPADSVRTAARTIGNTDASSRHATHIACFVLASAESLAASRQRQAIAAV